MSRSDAAPHQGRMACVQQGLRERGFAAAVFGLTSNLRYLTGFVDEPGERALLLILPSRGEATMVVPKLYADEVQLHRPAASIHVWQDGDDPMEIVREVAEGLTSLEGGVLLDDTLWASFVLPIQRAFDGRSFESASKVVGAVRIRKAPEEIAAMKRAGEIADRALEEALEDPIVGATESELARRLESAMLDGDAEGIGFETLVASGPNGALPHYRAGSRRIEPGDVVILDYGCRVDGYCSDMTRSVVCGEPTETVMRAYDTVQKAYWAAREAVTPGVEAEKIDDAARAVFETAGIGRNFLHRTGHGIGLDVHEPPYIVQGNQELLQTGMAFSIEPGAYFAGEFGIRLEDVVIVGEGGAVPMTEAPRNLRRVK